MNNKPLVSLCVLTYNQADFIIETLDGLISQDYENLEIIVSDDRSPDNTFDSISEYSKNYKGKHKLIINENEKNLGLVRHFNHVIFDLCHGDYILLTGGDDICMPHLVSCAVEHVLRTNCCAIHVNSFIINSRSLQTGIRFEEKNIDDIFTINDYIRNVHKSNGACRMVKKDVYTTFGALNHDCPTEDTTTLLRCFLYGEVGMCYVPNHKYRVHANNISGTHSLMTRFDPHKIYNQYDRDISLAQEKGLITDSEAQSLRKKIDSYLRVNLAIRKIYNAKGEIKRYLYALSFLFKKGYSLKDVISFVKQIRRW